MFYLLLASGTAFVAAGAVLAAQARVIDAGLPVPRPALALLAGFAVLHGASDLAELALEHERTRGGATDAPEVLHLVLLAASFVMLLGFALALVGTTRRRSTLAAGIGFSALAVWGVALTALLEASNALHRTVPSATVDVLTRWVLGVPANVCAAIALLALAPTLELESWVGSRLVRAAGFAFLVHGAGDAFGALPTSLQAGWPANAEAMVHAAGFPLFDLLDSLSAAAIGLLLSEAFVFQTSQRLRREESHLRDDFIALVAHELGNPVAGLELAAERLDLARRAGRVPDARLGDDVKACALTLRRIVTDLLDTSRVQAQELEISPVRVEVRPALDRAAEVASSYQGADRAVTVACPDSLPAVLADPARLDQILGNLLTNAAKYSASGSGVVVAAEADGGRVAIRVVNEGPCIAPGEVARIFSRHYRAHAAVRGAARGLGLGLYVARALVEAQGGRIWVESHDQRTAFCFTLPQAGALPTPTLVPGGDSRSATA